MQKRQTNRQTEKMQLAIDDNHNKETIWLLHDETQLTKLADELCKTVLKLGNPESSRTLVKLSRRLYPRKIFIHLL